jgi:hypothetical protein
MHRDYADVSCDGRQHGREELDCTAWPERRSLEIAKLIRGTQNPALREVYFGRAAGDRRCRVPQPSRVGIEGPFFLRISSQGARAIEQVTAADTLAVQCYNDLLVRASCEAMKQDRIPTECHAQRGSSVVMRWAAAHALVLTPCSIEAFDDRTSAAIEVMSIHLLGHRPTPFDVPLPRSLSSEGAATDFPPRYVLYMF